MARIDARHLSTGDRTILGKISKRGNRYLRVLLTAQFRQSSDSSSQAARINERDSVGL
jgi:transposase